MVNKDGSVTFGDWYRGQAVHPVFGIGLVQNLEVFENPGIAKLKSRPIISTNITPTGLPIAQVETTHGVFTLTGDTGASVLWKQDSYTSTASSIATLSQAWDAVFYKDYVWVRYGTSLGAYGPVSSGAQWFSSISITVFETDYYGKLLVGQDDYLYATSGNIVRKIEVLTSGTVAVAPTVSISTTLDLKDGQYSTTLEEYGRNIIVGTQGGDSYVNRTSAQVANLYPWNRQAGTLGNPGLADLPVKLSVNGINAILQHGNKLYIQAGTRGNIYVSDGTNYSLLTTLPFTQNGINSNSVVFPNAMAISSKGHLLVGVSVYGDGYARGGVYEVNLNDPKYPVSFRTISTGSTGTSTTLKIGFVKQIDYQTLAIGWSDGATYGVDYTSSTVWYGYGGVMETEMTKVGTYDDKRTFEFVEWCLAEPLVSGQAIRISYRKNNKEAYTLINTWGYASSTGVKGVGGVLSFSDIAAISDAEYIQLKVELEQALGTTVGSNVNLITIRLW